MKLLYKYIKEPNHVLKEGYIRATQLSALNDPFEAVYCQKSLKELASNFEYEQVDELIDYVEKNKQKVGVISLTEAKDNLLMWSHYANEHKGVALGLYLDLFEGSTPFAELFKLRQNNSSFTEKYELFNGACHPVIYRKQPRYHIDMYDFDYSNIIAEGKDRILFEIFQQKSDEWIYEKEHRIVLRLEQADKVIVYDLENLSSPEIIKRIKKSGFCQLSGKGSERKHIISLDNVKDGDLREEYASDLAELALNPKNLYLFKLAPHSISSIILGFKSDYDFSDLSSDYFSIRPLNRLKAELNTSFYTIKFKELDET